MRTLLATLLLVPALALAQSNLEPPTSGTRTPPRPQRGQKGRPVLPRPAVRSPRGVAAENLPSPSSPPGVRRIPTAPPPAPVAPAAAAGGGEATITPAEGRCVPLQGRFMLAFNKADIVDVLEQASRWTCRNFIYTDDIARGKITLLSKTPVTSEEAYAAFLAALSANNIVIYPTGKYYKLGRAPDSKKLPIPTYTDPESGVPATEQVVTKVIRLQSTDADMLRGVLGNFISPQGADIQSIPPDTLIITDIAINIRRIEKILESVDRSGGADVIRVIQIRYAAARDIADKLNQIFQAQGQGRKGIAAARPQGRTGAPPPPGAMPPGAQSADIITVSKVLADDRTNKLIVIADDKSFQRVHELLEQLDVPTGADGGIHVVFLKNASAEEMATTLSSLAQGQSKRAGGAPGAPAIRGAPGAPAVPESTTAELFSGEVKVTADKTQNALLVQASGADFAAISRLVEKLDRPRRQVFVEAVIMEVNITNQTNVGVAAHAFVDVEVNGKKGAIPLFSTPNSKLNTLDLKSIAGLGGFLTGFSGPTSGVVEELTGLKLPSLGVLMQALQSNDDVNVLSTPNVLATDNEEAEIAVGENRPFQTGYFPSGLSNLLSSAGGAGATTALTGGLSNFAAGIQRQNVELRLKMKPQINEGGAVRLTVEVQNETVAAENETLGPTTAKRSVKTQIVAKDQSTIVIGGLIQDTTSRSVSKVPVLGSLPVLGGLFRSSQTVKKRTNLLVFLTPYIIRNEGDYRRIYEKKRKEQEEFLSQFYGKKSGLRVDVDYSRKSSPLSRIHQGVTEESSKIQNGGPGLPGEGMTTPFPPGEAPERSGAGQPAATPQETPAPVAPEPPGDQPAPPPDGTLPVTPDGSLPPPPQE
jgi:general secretion pathway protein D